MLIGFQALLLAGRGGERVDARNHIESKGSELANPTRAEVLNEIYAALERVNELREPSERLECGEETRLYGGGGPLDSLTLLALILDLEEAIASRTGAIVVLADERAVAQSRSPFRDVRSLTDHVLSRLDGNPG